MTLSTIISLAIGVAMLFFGRRLFSLFVAVAGFLLGYWLAGLFIEGADSTLLLLAGLVTGAIFALLATRFLKLVVSIAAFVLMGMAAWMLATRFGLEVTGWSTIVIFVIGGLIGLSLETFVFDVGIIVITSLVGAQLIVAGMPQLLASFQADTLFLLAVFVLTGVGIAFQLSTRKSG